MNEAFLIVFRALGINGDGLDGAVCTTDELIAQMRANPDFLAEQRGFWEHVWTTVNRGKTEVMIEAMVITVRYLSNLVDGDVPVLMPREDVLSTNGSVTPDDRDAVRLGRAMQGAIAKQVVNHSAEANQKLFADLQSLFLSAGANNAQRPASTSRPSKLLNARDMAEHLSVSTKTVRRACISGQIDADKTKGGEWRTTVERLKKSPYLNGKRRGRKGEGHAQLER